MTKTILVIVKWLLIAWGGISLAGMFVIAGFIAYHFGPGNRDKIDMASPQDVRFVLNWCNLGDNRIEKVVNSYVSARSFLGDHRDAYAIKITHVGLDELTANKDGWYRGDQLPKVLDEAVSFVGGMLGSDSISWFPKEKDLRSSEIYVYPWSIYCHGVRPSAAEIIFIRPKDKMVFFFSGKT